jgi:hypothetical protein
VRVRNPFGEDAGIVIALGVVGYLIYRHYTAAAAATAAANAQALAAQSQGPSVANVNPGNAFWTGGASLYTPAAYGV